MASDARATGVDVDARRANVDDATRRSKDARETLREGRARDDDDAPRDDDDGSDDGRVVAHEDYSCATPFETLARDAETTLREWLDEDAATVSTRASAAAAFRREFREHGLHWRKEAYGCEMYVDVERLRRGRAWETLRGKSLLELARDAGRDGARASSEYDARKRTVDGFDYVTFFDCACVILVRPMSASGAGQFVDDDEALTVRSAFALAMSALRVGGAVAVATPRGFYERDFSADVCAGDDNDDAVCETDVTRFTRFSSREEVTARTFAGCVNAFYRSVRETRRSNPSTADIDAETKALESSIVSARITREFTRAKATTSPMTSEIEDESDDDDFGLRVDEWDDDCPWAAWVHAEDPWRTLEVDALWLDVRLDCVTFSDLDVEDAPIWRLRGDLTQAARDRGEEDDAVISSDTSSMSEAIFSLIESAEIIRGEDVEDVTGALDTMTLASAEFWVERGYQTPHIPNDETARGVTRDIFTSFATTALVTQESFREPYKTAPANSILARFALHACCSLKNPRAVAHSWNAFARELRREYWERGRLVPGVVRDEILGIDHGACIVYQKLQMLNQCIARRNAKSDAELHASTRASDGAQPRSADSPRGDEFDRLLKTTSSTSTRMRHPVDDELDLNALLSGDVELSSAALERAMSGSESATTAKSDEYASAEEDLSPEDGDDSRAEGVSETLKIRLLNAPHAFIRAPITQEAPCMTEDALAEREAALRAFGDDDEGRAARQRIQSDSLVSDMSAFKAANPRAVFEDFVRWHSPKDWIVSGAGEEQTDESSGRLSDRMRRDGNTWLELWTRAPRVPAHKQHPLFDPIVEGEKAMHYLETIPATALFDVAARCACAATAAILSSWWLTSSEEASARAPAETHESIKTAIDTCSHFFARTEPLTLDEYDFVFASLQVAERATFRAASARARLPDAPPDLISRLLTAADACETIRARDIPASSLHVVYTDCQSPAERAYLALRLERRRRVAEFAVRASPPLPDHAHRVIAYDDHTRICVRTAARPRS